MTEHSVQIEPEAASQAPVHALGTETGPSAGLSQKAAYKRDVETYGSFMIGDIEFALPVGVVREVVHEPETVSAIPLSPDYMIGLFTLRDMIVPMIDLRSIFGFPPVAKTGDRKVTIIEDGETYLGLVFDNTGEVLHAQQSERVTFQKRADGIKDVISRGVLKLEEGKRLLQVLDPYEILNLERVPRVGKKDKSAQSSAGQGDLLHCISFEVGHSKYAFELGFVQEVMEVTEIKQSFLSHGFVLGSITRRGRIIPVVDFRGFVGKQSTNVDQICASDSNKLLIVNLLEGQIGLLVYSIDSIIRYFKKDVLPFSSLAMPHEAIFAGCLTDVESDLVMLFDHVETMKQPELLAAAQCCQELYPNSKIADVQEEKRERQRRTFITFSTECEYAMDMMQVREVVERPTDLIKPPNAPKSVIGLFNLREDLITLIDLRILYEERPTAVPKQRVVVFNCGDKMYGVLVDSVDEIIMTTSDMVIPFEATSGHLSEGGASQDVSEMVQVTAGRDSLTSIMVLDVEALIQRSIGV